MRHSFLVLLWLMIAAGVAAAQSATFPLPKSHPWNPKGKIICSSVGSVGIRQAKETPEASEYFLVEAGRGDTRLEITVAEKELQVSVNGAAPEKYKVASNSVGILTAVSIGEIESTVSSISIDKVTSYVVWSITEPRDFTRDVPRHTAALLTCSSEAQP